MSMPKGRLLETAEMARLREMMLSDGESAVSERFGITGYSLARACAGLPCYPATLFVIRLALEQAHAAGS